MSLKQLADAMGNLCELAAQEAVHRQECNETANTPTLQEMRDEILSKYQGSELETRRKLWDQFTENTGQHFLDSGGAYGRAWQRNQLRDFEAEARVKLSFEYDYMDFQVSTYHWLADRLEYNELMTRSLLGLGNAPKYKREGWLHCMEEWVKHKFPEAGGIYGEGEPLVVDTYNHENFLDATLQYIYFCDHKGEFLVLQVHGGADVRGGYTAPVVYNVTGDELCILDDNRWELSVDLASATNLPDPDQLRLDGEPTPVYVPRWSGCEGVCIDEHQSKNVTGWRTPSDWEDINRYEHSDDPRDRGQGKLYVDEDGNGYCPHTGGKLQGWVY